MSKSEHAILGSDVIEKLIPMLNLDPKKLYLSISVKAAYDDVARITTETIVSEVTAEDSDG
jgi:hypothetical protein